MPHILVCGLTTADFVFAVPTMPERAEKYIANDAQMIIGGGAANAAIAIARQEGTVILAARIGDDWVGKAVVQVLNDENIDCSLLQICTGATTSFSSVLIDDGGERQIVNFRGTGFNEQPHWLSCETPPIFNASDLDLRRIDAVLTDTRWTEGAVAVLQMARRLGIPGVVDAEAPMSNQILEAASHVAFSKQGLRAYINIDDTEAALLAAKANLDAWVCVTDGSNGVFHVHNGNIQHTPIHRIEVKDTLGAGDVWHGVFTLGLSDGQDEQSAIEYANAAATLKCAAQGGGMAAPTKDQTEQFILQMV